VDEARLALEFGVFGDISSVKVMWPRTDEERRKGKNCGFVSFMRRADAEEALSAMDGVDLNGMRISVVWSKRVQLPPQPLLTQAAVVWARATGNDPEDYERMVGRVAEDEETTPETVFAIPAGCLRHEVAWPSSAAEVARIEAVAKRIAMHGPVFEALVCARGEHSFTRVHDPLNVYYRWRVWALQFGQSLEEYSIAPFQVRISFSYDLNMYIYYFHRRTLDLQCIVANRRLMTSPLSIDGCRRSILDPTPPSRPSHRTARHPVVHGARRGPTHHRADTQGQTSAQTCCSRRNDSIDDYRTRAAD